jgi:hypothetical protein
MVKLMRLYFLICIIGLTALVNAQSKLSALDSLKNQFQKDSAHVYRLKKFRPYADLDHYQTYLNDALVNIRGFNVGVMYKNRHIFGLGLHGITKLDQKKAVTRFRDTVNVTEQLSLRYMSLFYQYTFINNRYLAVFMPTQLGLGRYTLTTDNVARNKRVSQKTGGTIPASIGATLVLKPVKWIGISGTGGYRIVLDKNPNLNFNGLFFGYGVWLDIQQIVRDIKFYGFLRPHYRKQIIRLQ